MRLRPLAHAPAIRGATDRHLVQTRGQRPTAGGRVSRPWSSLYGKAPPDDDPRAVRDEAPALGAVGRCPGRASAAVNRAGTHATPQAVYVQNGVRSAMGYLFSGGVPRLQFQRVAGSAWAPIPRHRVAGICRRAFSAVGGWRDGIAGGQSTLPPAVSDRPRSPTAMKTFENSKVLYRIQV